MLRARERQERSGEIRLSDVLRARERQERSAEKRLSDLLLSEV